MSLMSTQRIILASNSAFRRKLLQDAGMSFDVVVATADERSIVSTDPAKLAMERAKLKALDVAMRHPNVIVIGADQVLSLDGAACDKVASEAEAIERLRHMSGREHRLVNGLCLASMQSGSDPKIIYEYKDEVIVRMRSLTDVEVTAYVRREKAWPYSVACYYYEAMGIQLMDSIEGSHSSVIGLPLIPLLSALRRLGINTLGSELCPESPLLAD
jgi:septum formation protein